jgi:hypothetical protein
MEIKLYNFHKKMKAFEIQSNLNTFGNWKLKKEKVPQR